MDERDERLLMADFPFSPLMIEEILELIERSWVTGDPETILYQNFHTLFLQTEREETEAAFRDAIAIVDSRPLISLLRASGVELDHSKRVTAVDLVDPVMALANSQKRRVFVIGQEPAVLQAALSELRSRHIGLMIEGHHGFFDTNSGNDDHVVAQANSFDADLVLVGMGSPRTELWCNERREDIKAPVVWACGALMEYVAGTVATPPRWAGPLGIEWAFRFLDDPKRFFGRYVLEPPVLATRVAKRLLARR